MFSMAVGLRGAPTTAVSPPVALRDDTMYGLIYAVSTRLFGGLAVGGTVALLLDPGTGPVIGAATAVASGQASGLGAARRYLAFLLCSRPRLPFRLGRFLDWACSAAPCATPDPPTRSGTPNCSTGSRRIQIPWTCLEGATPLASSTSVPAWLHAPNPGTGGWGGSRSR